MSAKRIALTFMVFGGVWILGSDHLLQFVTPDVETLSHLQSVKGLVFVVLSTLLIYGLARWSEHRRQAVADDARQQGDRLTSLLEVTPAVLYSLTIDPQFPEHWHTAFVSANVERVTGYPVQQWLGDISFWKSLLHPEDRDRVLGAQQGLLAQGALHHEYRIRHADGGHRWIDDTVRVLRNGSGQPVGITGVWLDVSDRRCALERSHLIEHMFESADEGIFITDAQGRIMSANRAFTRITGYTTDEVAGKTPALLKSGRQNAAFYVDLWRRLIDHGQWEGEIWNRRKCGEVYPQWLKIGVIRGDRGQAQQYLAVFTETSGSKDAAERIHRLANYDPLTELPNRALLADRAQVALAAAARQSLSAAVLHVNIDRFSVINESHGRDAGDRVLQQTAQRLSEGLRPEDTLCRLGGDDFVLLLPGLSIHDVAQTSLRLMDAVARPLQGLDDNGDPLTLSACIGVALYPENGTDLAQLSRAAEHALHQAKRDGRHTVRVASRELQQQVQESLTIASDLRSAVSRNQLVLHYQAQVDARSLRVIGAEALVRWRHPTRGMISPGVFIPVAEESGLIRDLGLWVMKEAIRQNAAWRDAGLPVVPLAINLSMAQFRDPALRETVESLLKQHALPAELLELELTESVAMENSDFTLKTISDLKDLGVRLSIDDFGTGYSSLAYLKRYAVDKLKIDQSFVRGLGQGTHDRAIVNTIIDLASNLGLHTVAEGVETEAQADVLRDQGCDVMQGFLFHRPVDAPTFEQVLRTELTLNLARHLDVPPLSAPACTTVDAS